MDKEKIKLRVEELKKQNDEGNRMLAELDQTRNQLIQEILIRNGRILELQRILESEA